MTDFAIKVDKLSKRYNLDKLDHKTFRESIYARAKSLANGADNGDASNEFWALKDISFELNKGDCLGIIGRNGAGKSTLLKIIGEITNPTSGEVEINGKVASVFEIGLGFHQDLSGMENLYLSGSMLGMSKNEIDNNLEEIIEFSGVGNFINVPVKHYSSGMNVRLAFSLIAHLSADIFLFDEVLSVGDAEFRLKTSKKINEMVKEGKTIILVTHNLGEILDICNRAIVLEQGEMKAHGSPLDLISDYAEEAHNLAQRGNVSPSGDLKGIQNFKVWDIRENAPGNDTARVQKMTVRGKGKELSEDIFMEDAIEVEISLQKFLPAETIDVGFTLHDSTGKGIFAATTGLSSDGLKVEDEGVYTASCEIPGNYLNKGIFTLNVFVVQNKNDVVHTSLSDVAILKVHRNKTEEKHPLADRFPGPLRPSLQWHVRREEGGGDLFS